MPIGLRHLLSSPTCDLPRTRKTDVSLSDQLATMHAEFCTALRTTDAGDKVCANALREISLIEEASEKVVSAVKDYLSGSPVRAATTLRVGLEKLRAHLETLVAPRQLL